MQQWKVISGQGERDQKGLGVIKQRTMTGKHELSA
jgi:hypothetical protein